MGFLRDIKNHPWKDIYPKIAVSHL